MSPARAAAALAWAAGIFALSSLSQPPGQPGPELVSYAAHAGEFAVLGFLLAAWLAPWQPGRRGRMLLLAAVASAAYGVTDELHQAFVPGRDASVLDWCADAAGSGLGVLSFELAVRRRLPGPGR